MIMWDGLQLIGMVIVALCMCVFIVPWALRSGREWVQDRIADKWCKHDMKLERTTSAGNKSWYKCKKCGRENYINHEKRHLTRAGKSSGVARSGLA